MLMDAMPIHYLRHQQRCCALQMGFLDTEQRDGVDRTHQRSGDCSGERARSSSRVLSEPHNDQLLERYTQNSWDNSGKMQAFPEKCVVDTPG